MSPGLPLLHAADAAVRVTLDERVLLVAALLFTIAVLVVWRAPIVRACRALAHRRAQRRAVWAGASLLAFFAVLPAVLPYDHIVAESGAHDTVAHASHCHDTPGACADAPVAAGFGQMLANEPLVVVPSLIVVLLLLAAPTLHGVTRRPDVPVPLRLIAL